MLLVFVGAVAQFPQPVKEHHPRLASALRASPLFRPAWMRFRNSMFWMYNKEHFTSVDARDDKGMGFSHSMTSHHFQLLWDGGSIEVEADDPSDSASRDAIRRHMSQIASMFSEGNFSLPMFIHDTLPPGVEGMKRLKQEISYTAENTAKGAQVRITTRNSEALKAVHDFLRFQIADHRTGDSLQVRKPVRKHLHPGDNLGRDAQPARD
jgi:hypothetical protein